MSNSLDLDEATGFQSLFRSKLHADASTPGVDSARFKAYFENPRAMSIYTSVNFAKTRLKSELIDSFSGKARCLALAVLMITTASNDIRCIPKCMRRTVNFI